MRLQLSLAAGLLLAARAATAQEAAGARAVEAGLHVYGDDDDVTVISPAAAARAPLGGGFSVDASIGMDVVTAASVDVTSQASPYGFEERRVEGGAGLSLQAAPALLVSGRVLGSAENDYRSLHAGAGLRVEGARRNTVLDVAYTAAFDRVGRAGDPRFDEPRRGHRLAVTLTQVVDERTFADVVFDGEVVTGYQASPYRYVPVVDAAGTRLYSVPEKTPELRLSAAGLVRLRRAVGDRWFLHVDYRLYGDDWGLRSHTGSALCARALRADRVTLGVQARAYTQGAATFYRAAYVDNGAGAPGWRTRDRALGGMRSLSGTLVADLALGGATAADGWHVVASLGGARFVWLDFPPQDRRAAVIGGVSVTAPF